jgi:hypothetical protein
MAQCKSCLLVNIAHSTKFHVFGVPKSDPAMEFIPPFAARRDSGQ